MALKMLTQSINFPFHLTVGLYAVGLADFLKRIPKNEKQNWKVKVNLMFVQIVVKIIRININRHLN